MQMRLIASLLLMPLAASGFQQQSSPKSAVSSRSDFLRNSAGAAGWFVATSTSIAPAQAAAEGSSVSNSQQQEKLIKLPDDQLKEIIKKDVVQNQFLCNGKLTRSVYDESATFQDEIDTYGLGK